DPSPGNPEDLLVALEQALLAAMLLTYIQGMNMLKKASEAQEYGLNMAEVARIWRGGCIIRAAMLNDLRDAYLGQPTLANLLLDRSGWLPTNLIQAQRDYFGAHTYERIDAEGTFHSVWKRSE
ncbi:MAG: NADP-dependent phosphogluconate dehydrogenase, partial [Gammaproteobacteria bacterium]